MEGARRIIPDASRSRSRECAARQRATRISLVAEEEGNIVGHAAFSPVTLANATYGAGLGPVAVLPALRRQGIAEKLIRAGLARCNELQFGYVVVLGDPDYYQRFGFHSAVRWGLPDEFGGGDAFQAMELRPGAIPKQGGLVRYAAEFAIEEG
ncbi:MAG TPA: N-acetyltransferase [bacterium]|nr:N-acetyltransferase [bacterium]